MRLVARLWELGCIASVRGSSRSRSLLPPIRTDGSRSRGLAHLSPRNFLNPSPNVAAPPFVFSKGGRHEPQVTNGKSVAKCFFSSSTRRRKGPVVVIGLESLLPTLRTPCCAPLDSRGTSTPSRQKRARRGPRDCPYVICRLSPVACSSVAQARGLSGFHLAQEDAHQHAVVAGAAELFDFGEGLFGGLGGREGAIGGHVHEGVGQPEDSRP
jgi:hypothetical protein